MARFGATGTRMGNVSICVIFIRRSPSGGERLTPLQFAVSSVVLQKHLVVLGDFAEGVGVLCDKRRSVVLEPGDRVDQTVDAFGDGETALRFAHITRGVGEACRSTMSVDVGVEQKRMSMQRNIAPRPRRTTFRPHR